MNLIGASHYFCLCAQRRRLKPLWNTFECGMQIGIWFLFYALRSPGRTLSAVNSTDRVSHLDHWPERSFPVESPPESRNWSKSRLNSGLLYYRECVLLWVLLHQPRHVWCPILAFLILYERESHAKLSCTCFKHQHHAIPSYVRNKTLGAMLLYENIQWWGGIMHRDAKQI